MTDGLSSSLRELTQLKRNTEAGNGAKTRVFYLPWMELFCYQNNHVSISKPLIIKCVLGRDRKLTFNDYLPSARHSSKASGAQYSAVKDSSGDSYGGSEISPLEKFKHTQNFT